MLTVRAHVQIQVSVKIPSMAYDGRSSVQEFHRRATREAIHHLEDMFKTTRVEGGIDCIAAGAATVTRIVSEGEDTDPVSP